MHPTRGSFVLLLFVGLLAFGQPDMASAGFERQVIRNATGSFANDLRLAFDSPVELVRFLTLAEGGQNATGVLEDGGLAATFAPRTIGLIPPTESGGAFIDFQVELGAYAALSRERPSIWTSNGQELRPPVTTIGAPPRLTDNLQGGVFRAFATFFNPETFSVTYSDIALYKNNRLTTFNIDRFYVPTGPPVPGLPDSVTLEPGASLTLSFGEVAPSLSQLALARVAATSTPNDFSRVAAAEVVVPEPSTITLLSVGALVMIGYGYSITDSSSYN